MKRTRGVFRSALLVTVIGMWVMALAVPGPAQTKVKAPTIKPIKPVKVPTIKPVKPVKVPTIKPIAPVKVPTIKPIKPVKVPTVKAVPEGEAAAKNSLVMLFANSSGSLAMVRIFKEGSNEQIAELVVADKDERSTPVSRGRYYFVVRYGSKKDEFTYARGGPFNMVPFQNSRVTRKVTLRPVGAEGNQNQKTADPESFGD